MARRLQQLQRWRRRNWQRDTTTIATTMAAAPWRLRDGDDNEVGGDGATCDDDDDDDDGEDNDDGDGTTKGCDKLKVKTLQV